MTSASPSSTSPCSWTVRLPHAGLRCARHDAQALPWRPVRGCDLPVASLCSVCRRVVVPVASRFAWSFLCPTCSGLDAALARPYGHRSMTPHHGQAHHDDDTLYGALFPDRLATVEVAEGSVTTRGVPRVTTRDVAPDGEPRLVRLARHARAVAEEMAAELDDADDAAAPAARVPLATWQGRFPASAVASAAAYQRYVTAVHPWIDTVEPRVADLAWLTTLTTLTALTTGR